MTVFVAVSCYDKRYLDPEWEDPHDWSKDSDPLDNLCPQNDNCEPCEKNAKFEYKRLVKTIFDPTQFRVCID